MQLSAGLPGMDSYRIAAAAVTPFLTIPESRWLTSNALAFAIAAVPPASHGHALVITRREVASWFDATADEQRAVMELVTAVKERLDRTLTPPPDGWSIGFDAGSAAGQAIPHLHVHVVPRWHGDGGAESGGTRVHASASAAPADLCIGHPGDPFLDRLVAELPGATAIDILAAFVQPGGVALIEPHLLAALAGGAAIRVLAGDYLGISSPVALRRLIDLAELRDQRWPTQAHLAVRVLELAGMAGGPTSFHPKAWRIERRDRTVVWVGSSNLSEPALRSGVEWNLRATSAEQHAACAAVTGSFAALWNQASPIDAAWIASYARRSLPSGSTLVPPEPSPEPWRPRAWQVTTLARLAELRAEGHRRALAAVATGMGKTVLAALDVAQAGGTSSSGPRVIVIAHRAELLAQSGETIRRALGWPAETTSWCVGDSGDLSGRLVLASVQKLSRPEMLVALAAQRFDYAIVDEVHHAPALSWRRVLDRLDSRFVLGLTATPERADGLDAATVFDDVIACDIGIGDGIREDALVPFAYHGLKDDVDYARIPWRSGGFDEATLERTLIGSPRMDRLWRAWQEHPGRRTLVFCANQRHALFCRDWLRRHGVLTAAVFAGERSDDRGEALKALADGRLQALCAVDLFNEGIDLPTVDRVVMLRPTASKVVFTQQLGRGLRTAPGKTRLVVIDFVGNHRAFGARLRHLLALAGLDGSARDLGDLFAGTALALPPGCLVDVELEAKDLLRSVLPNGGGAVVDGYRELREDLGRRPTPTELLHRGYLPSTLRGRHDHWFAFVAAEGDLDADEGRVLAAHGDWLAWAETMSPARICTLIALRILLDADGLIVGQHAAVHAEKSRAFLVTHPPLRTCAFADGKGIDPGTASPERWASWWQSAAIDRSDSWLCISDGRIRARLTVDEPLVSSLALMTDEIVTWRLAAYVERRSRTTTPAGFLGKVSRNSSGGLILFLPDAQAEPQRPVGPTAVTLPDGTTWTFYLVKIACNVAKPTIDAKNRLSELLRGWFGPAAGTPGTDFQVRFACQDGRWSIAPQLSAQEPATPPVTAVTGRPARFTEQRPAGGRADAWIPVVELAAAATAFSGEQHATAIGWVPPAAKPAPGAFLAQVRGRSMEPTIPDGAWCLFRPVPGGSRDGKVLLVVHRAISDSDHGGRFTVKRYRSRKVVEADGWRHTGISLVPDNPSFPAIEIDAHQAEDLRVVAEFVCSWS